MRSKTVVGALILCVFLLAFLDPFLDSLGALGSSDPLFLNLNQWAPWFLIPVAMGALILALKDIFD